MRYLFIMLLASCDGCDSILVPYCPGGESCWPGDEEVLLDQRIPELAYLGACKPGRVVCGADDSVYCADAVGPADETCDNIDNNCNGRVDEGFTIQPHAPANDCDLCGICESATKICSAGQWSCQPVFTPEPEQCNGLDDDCDCEVDDGLGVQFFYPIEQYPNTVGIGECRPGVLRCQDGASITTPPITPTEDICDDRDNDCDGLTDEVFEAEPRHFLLAIDISGSMFVTLQTLRDSLCDFSVGAQTGSRFAVVTFGGQGDAPYVNLIQDFGGAAETCITLGGSLLAGGNEYAVEAILVSGGLDWPVGVEASVVVFTDEPLVEAIAGSIGEAMSLCQTVPFEAGVYTSQGYFDDWTQLVESCGGFVDQLGTGQEFGATLLNRFFGNCHDQ